jgi:pyridoxine 5-phosphate synthase
MTKLSVNVNKVATLRNSRGGNTPNVRQVSMDILRFGAHGLTVHPRPDGRHIRASDVLELSELLQQWNKSISQKVEFNIEGYPDERYLQLLDEVRPDQATLVPDPPDVITSNAGWKLSENEDFLKKVVAELKSYNCRVSLFIDVFQWNDKELESLSRIGADRVELFTESYAKAFASPEQEKVLQKYFEVGHQIHLAGFGVNAGHDLDHENLGPFITRLPFLQEVSIGHALISQALYWGLEKTLHTYLKNMGYGSSST